MPREKAQAAPAAMLAGELALAGVDIAIVERRASGLGIGDFPRKTFYARLGFACRLP
jgi:hypothetical protein